MIQEDTTVQQVTSFKSQRGRRQSSQNFRSGIYLHIPVLSTKTKYFKMEEEENRVIFKHKYLKKYICIPWSGSSKEEQKFRKHDMKL